MQTRDLLGALESVVFRFRGPVLVLILAITAYMAYAAMQTQVKAGFEKMLPLEHEYMEPFLEHRADFGGANRVMLALVERDGDIFNPEFFATLQKVTDEVFFIPGVDRARVSSLFTPNVRYMEVVESGFQGGPVIPSAFEPTPAMLEQVRQNIIKSGEVGRIVSDDFTAAMVSADLLDVNPQTGERLNYAEVAERLESIRAEYADDDTSIHIIGFAKLVGDISEAIIEVIGFFAVAVLITALLLYLYSGSVVLTVLPLLASGVAVIWQFGLLNLLGYGIDPMSILVPFLVFAIGVSHGVQMINGWMTDILDEGADSLHAARAAFRRLLLPGIVALVSDTAGFLTILTIDIGIIQEMAVTASLGVAVIIITNLVLLPILMSYVRLPNLEGYRQRARRRQAFGDGLWHALSHLTERGPASIVLVLAAGLFLFGFYQAGQIRVGDLQAGAPELRADSRYNQDVRIITDKFDVGVDVMTIYAETVENACTDYDIMNNIDRFTWAMRNVEGVQSVIALPAVAKVVNAGYNEGNLKWRVIPRNHYALVQSISAVGTNTGLLNTDCSVMPIHLFADDHKAETITRLIEAGKAYNDEFSAENLKFDLAGGNVGVMAATNEAVQAAQLPMLLYVYGAILLLCLVSYRSLRATLCIVLPLTLVSVLAYALMVYLDIGLKVATLPVAALGVGIGVDYGIYIYSRVHAHLNHGDSLKEAYYRALHVTGKPVLFTAMTLAIGVSTWMLSDLKFQADMGVLLTFMFLVNMLGAILILPALAHFLVRDKQTPTAAEDGRT